MYKNNRVQSNFSKIISLFLVLSMLFGSFQFTGNSYAEKATMNEDDSVKNVLVYAKSNSLRDVLVAILNVDEMKEYLDANKDTVGKVHNYSIIDNFPAVVHQEAKGFTVPELIEYAKSKSSVPGAENISFSGKDRIIPWTIDGNNFNEADSYTFDDLYGQKRYNFPKLYENWDEKDNNYKDKEAVWESREETVPVLSVVGYSERAKSIARREGDESNLENIFEEQHKLDTSRTMRLMLPMTEKQFEDRESTASQSRWGIAYLMLDMETKTNIGKTDEDSDSGYSIIVDEPTYEIVDGDVDKSGQFEPGYCYFKFKTNTPGATILYNDNSKEGYIPTAVYKDGEYVKAKKTEEGLATVTAIAVKEGYMDHGPVICSNHVDDSAFEDEVVSPDADVWDGKSSTEVVEKDGVYSVKSAAELKWISDQVNSGNTFEGKTINLENDIHLNNEKWKPIGDLHEDFFNNVDRKNVRIDTYSFGGIFDGKGHTVSGLNSWALTEELGASYRVGRHGLFGYVVNAEIKNLTVSGTLTRGLYDGNGGIIGEAAGTLIENCVNNVNINLRRLCSGGNIGGVLGLAYDTRKVILKNCINNGDFINARCNYYGGIAGYGAEVYDSVNNGNITILNPGWHGVGAYGGIVGGFSNATNCRNNGSIKGVYDVTDMNENISSFNYKNADYSYLRGGILGTRGKVVECINDGDIEYGSGIFGSRVNAVRCVNRGKAAIAGIGSSFGEIHECMNIGDAPVGLSAMGAKVFNSYNANQNVEFGLLYQRTKVIRTPNDPKTDSPLMITQLNNSFSTADAPILNATDDSENLENAYYRRGTNPLVFLSRYSPSTREYVYEDATGITDGSPIKGIIPKSIQYIVSKMFVDELNANAGKDIFERDLKGYNKKYPKFIWDKELKLILGDNEEISRRVMVGEKLDLIPIPNKDNYKFDGWYYDKELSKKLNSDSKVEDDMTLYAKWIEEKEEVETPDKPEGTEKPDKPEGTEKPDKPEGTEKPDKPEGTEKPDKPEGTEKPDKPEETEKPGKPEEPKKPDILDKPKEWKNPFTDVLKEAWYYDSVRFANEKGLFLGTTDTLFSPDIQMSRGMLVTVLHRLEGKPSVKSKSKFNDVKENLWFTDGVKWALENKIIQGYGDNKFGPNDNITREQIATILKRYSEFKKTYSKEKANLSKYDDKNEISGWAKDSIEWANKVGIIKGRTNKLLVPKGDATRAEVATMIKRYTELGK